MMPTESHTEEHVDYGNLLSRAWQITWKHKILWIFGILAGSGGGFRFGGNFPSSNGRNPNGSPLPPDLQAQLSRPEVVAVLLALGCVVLVIGLILFLVGVVARGGLIGGIKRAADGNSPAFRETWSIGTHNFGRLLGIGLLLLVPLIVIAIVFGGIALLTAGLGLICLVPLLCLIVPAYVVASIITGVAQYAVVLEGLPVMDALRRAWALLTANLGPFIIGGLIVVFIEFVIGIVLFLPVLVIVVPTFFAVVLTGGNQPNLGALALGGVAVVCYLPILIVLSGILNTWSTAFWTLLYGQVAGNSPATASAPAPAPAMP